MTTKFIDTATGVSRMLDAFDACRPPLILFIGLLGVSLSRHGSLDIMQIHCPGTNTAYIIDVYELQDGVFDTPSQSGTTLHDILESHSHAKVFFDVCRASNALFFLYNVDLAGVLDIQLLEYATRSSRHKNVKGLPKCIEESCRGSCALRGDFTELYNAGQELIASERGGTREIIQERPLHPVLLQYCVITVIFLPDLLLAYGRKLRHEPGLAAKIHVETLVRISTAQELRFPDKSKEKNLGPLSSKFLPRKSSPPLHFPMTLFYSGDLNDHCHPNATLRESNSLPHHREPLLGTADVTLQEFFAKLGKVHEELKEELRDDVAGQLSMIQQTLQSIEKEVNKVSLVFESIDLVGVNEQVPLHDTTAVQACPEQVSCNCHQELGNKLEGEPVADDQQGYDAQYNTGYENQHQEAEYKSEDVKIYNDQSGNDDSTRYEHDPQYYEEDGYDHDYDYDYDYDDEYDRLDRQLPLRRGRAIGKSRR